MVTYASQGRTTSLVDDTVASFNDALGPSVRLRRVVRSDSAIGAVGRWRHSGARVNLSELGTTQIVFNLRGDQKLEWWQDAVITRGVACCGSASVVRQDTTAQLSISGFADTVQIVLDPSLLRPALNGPSPSVDQREQSLQALSAQALVALTIDDAEQLARTVSAAAAAMIANQVAPSRVAQGGLGRGTRARIRALVENKLRERPDRLPSVAELASLSGLSLSHFIRAFKASEGLTPRAWIAARQIDYALRLLLEDQAPVGEAAERTGYCSPSHFVSDFRRRLGVTPAQLRDAAKHF